MMRWSWRIARPAGIDVYLDWTFLILLVWLVVVHARARATVEEIVQGVGLLTSENIGEWTMIQSALRDRG